MFGKSETNRNLLRWFSKAKDPLKVRGGPPSVAQLILMHSHARVVTYTHLSPVQEAMGWHTLKRSDVLASMIRKFAK